MPLRGNGRQDVQRTSATIYEEDKIGEENVRERERESAALRVLSQKNSQVSVTPLIYYSSVGAELHNETAEITARYAKQKIFYDRRRGRYSRPEVKTEITWETTTCPRDIFVKIQRMNRKRARVREKI